MQEYIRHIYIYIYSVHIYKVVLRNAIDFRETEDVGSRFQNVISSHIDCDTNLRFKRLQTLKFQNRCSLHGSLKPSVDDAIAWHDLQRI